MTPDEILRKIWREGHTVYGLAIGISHFLAEEFNKRPVGHTHKENETCDECQGVGGKDVEPQESWEAGIYRAYKDGGEEGVINFVRKLIAQEKLASRREVIEEVKEWAYGRRLHDLPSFKELLDRLEKPLKDTVVKD